MVISIYGTTTIGFRLRKIVGYRTKSVPTGDVPAEGEHGAWGDHLVQLRPADPQGPVSSTVSASRFGWAR
jgi:hypothetical protein